MKAFTVAAALWMTACSSCKSKPIPAGSEVASGSLSPEVAAQVLAKVGERTITVGDYVAAIEHMDQFDRLRYQAAPRRKELLEEMITVMLLADEAREKGYDKDPITQQEVRAILRDAVLRDARKGLPAPAEISEGEVRGYYDAHRSDYRDPERRRLSLIVAADEAKAKEVLDAAKKSPSAADWGQLVRTKSVDPQARANVPVDLAGDVGMVSPPGDSRGVNPKVPEEVRVAAFAIPAVNGIYERPVKGENRFYVIRLTQKAEAHERTYAEAERTIRVKLSQDKIRAREEELLSRLRKEIPVEVDEAALATVTIRSLDAGADSSAQ